MVSIAGVTYLQRTGIFIAKGLYFCGHLVLSPAIVEPNLGEKIVEMASVCVGLEHSPTNAFSVLIHSRRPLAEKHGE